MSLYIPLDHSVSTSTNQTSRFPTYQWRHAFLMTKRDALTTVLLADPVMSEAIPRRHCMAAVAVQADLRLGPESVPATKMLVSVQEMQKFAEFLWAILRPSA
jgi:hypothetical protein